MTIEQLIQFIENRIKTLEKASVDFFAIGDLEKYTQTICELTECKLTLKRLTDIYG